ncbi:MAG: response regulator, partial [Bacteroidales bacterium]|nr:response regulator [Bacteroidales bacterium]
LWKTITNNKTWEGELANKRKNGEVFWEHATISPILNAQGEIINYMKVSQNITKQVNIKEQLQIEKQRAEEADKLKSSFLANMSHEIRTPMNAIIGFGQLLNDPWITEDQKQEYIQVINLQGEHLLTLINDIIDISKIEVKGLLLREEICNVRDLVMDLKSFFSQNRINAIDIKTLIPDERHNHVILADATRLRQVLTNLIGNAVKFTSSGYVEFGYAFQEEEYIRFFVKDTGIGIPLSKMEKIFNRFYQVENQNKDTLTRGTGLGLAIAKALVHLMGGKIWVESEEYVGSTFYFTIPYKSAVHVEKPVIVPTSNYKGIFQNKKVLVVEDIESNYLFVQHALKVTEADIFWAKNGMEAIEKFKNHPSIDIIIMDMNMPILNGYEATKKIKQMHSHIPVIALTAYAMEGDRKKSH